MTARTTARPTIVRISVEAPLLAWLAAAVVAASLRLSGAPSPLAATAPAGSTRRPPRAAASGRVSTKFRTEDHSLHRRLTEVLERSGCAVPPSGHATARRGAGRPRAAGDCAGARGGRVGDGGGGGGRQAPGAAVRGGGGAGQAGRGQR